VALARATVARTPILVTIAVPLIALTPNRDASRRFAIGSVAGLRLLTAFTYAWEFAAGGAALEYTYYFSYWSTWIALATAAVAAMVFGALWVLRRRRLGALVAALAVGLTAFASSHATNSSRGVFVSATSAPSNGDVYHAGIKLVSLVRKSGLDAPGRSV
jgi:hypothetical protein